MKLQSMTVIFVIIFLPIILVSTYYIQREVDTIALQTSYDTKLIDATTDAISAFEINTSNEDLSSVSDSLRSIIEASNNVFTTTMATNLGMSSATKSKILPYIPAVVYTLYDGYYIYTPTQQPKIVTNQDGVYVKVGDEGVSKDSGSGKYYYNYKAPSGSLTYTDVGGDYGKILYYAKEQDFEGKKIECTTDSSNAYYTTNYILKSFIPYSAQYKTNNIDVTINYTLDNFVTVYGTIDGIYYSKSGYLIDYKNLTKVTLESNEINIYDVGLDELDSYINSSKTCTITYDGVSINFDRNTLNSAKSEDYTGDMVYDNESAIKYYLKAAIFSKWFDQMLGDLNEENIQFTDISDGFNVVQNGENLENDTKLFYTYTNKSIFKTDGKWDVENSESNFYEHKRNVIKNSIQYNLNLAMAVYNAGQGDEYYQMPILSEVEWDKLLSNVSILAFMQGLPCGLKTYSNYAIVTSTNNELMANVDDIYYIPIINNSDGVKTSEDKTGNLDTCHRIDCNKLATEIEGGDVQYFQSFPSREVKYDKEYEINKYVYDHVVNTCYDCIVDSNYESNTELSPELKEAEIIAVAKIKNNTYKSSALTTNYGLEFVNFSTPKTIGYSKGKYTLDSKLGIGKCYEIQVTIKNAQSKSGSFWRR